MYVLPVESGGLYGRRARGRTGVPILVSAAAIPGRLQEC